MQEKKDYPAIVDKESFLCVGSMKPPPIRKSCRKREMISDSAESFDFEYSECLEAMDTFDHRPVFPTDFRKTRKNCLRSDATRSFVDIPYSRDFLRKPRLFCVQRLSAAQAAPQPARGGMGEMPMRFG